MTESSCACSFLSPLSCWIGEVLPKKLINDPLNAYTLIFICILRTSLFYIHPCIYIYMYMLCVFISHIYMKYMSGMLFSKIDASTNHKSLGWVSGLVIRRLSKSMFWYTPFNLPCLEFRQSSDASSRPCRFRLGMVLAVIQLMFVHFDEKYISQCMYIWHACF